MLKGEMPFGSWRESELTFARIAKGQFTLPETFSHEAVDLISKVRCGLYPFSSKKSLSTNLSSLKKKNLSFSYLKLMRTRDSEVKVLPLSKVTPGFTVLIGKE